MCANVITNILLKVKTLFVLKWVGIQKLNILCIRHVGKPQFQVIYRVNSKHARPFFSSITQSDDKLRAYMKLTEYFNNDYTW